MPRTRADVRVIAHHQQETVATLGQSADSAGPRCAGPAPKRWARRPYCAQAALAAARKPLILKRPAVSERSESNERFRVVEEHAGNCSGGVRRRVTDFDYRLQSQHLTAIASSVDHRNLSRSPEIDSVTSQLRHSRPQDRTLRRPPDSTTFVTVRSRYPRHPFGSVPK